jgi:hypothetical protein
MLFELGRLNRVERVGRCHLVGWPPSADYASELWRTKTTLPIARPQGVIA